MNTQGTQFIRSLLSHSSARHRQAAPWLGALAAGAALFGALPDPALAGNGPIEQNVTIDRIESVDNANGAQIGLRGCPQNIVSNAANFSSITQGSQITLQLGLVEGEGFAVTFSVPANQYPIEVNTVEFLIGTVANITTTTGYSVIIWDGLPENPNGTARAFDPLVDQLESSEPNGSQFGGFDDIVLTPANATCTTSTTSASAARVSIGIDPNEPPADRWILTNSRGENVFTVVIRIDRHNNNASPTCGPFNRCLNAFLATEANVGGALNFASSDWLLAIDCGATFICAGGYTKFSDLNALCKPTRDPLIGATWTSLGCAAQFGACCDTNGACTLTTQADCAGTWDGAFAACQPGACPEPTGACCFGTNCSTGITETTCGDLSGVWLGANTTCAAGSTCPTGACCLTSGSCVAGVTAIACSQAGGTFRGVGTTCASPCPQPTGACCTPSGSCAVVNLQTCGFAGGTWSGAGTTCQTTVCGSGACCTGTTCTITAATSCGGTYLGTNTTCQGSPTNHITCCPANFDLLDNVTADDIFAFLDAWFAQSGQTGPSLSADFDRSTVVTADDIFSFLDAWFAQNGGTGSADFNGADGVTADDIFAFLDAWFAGNGSTCP